MSFFVKNFFTALFVIFILLIIVYSRIYFGVDFNDEMQYAGQIQSLLRTGELFRNDLFFQQIVYVYFLPLYKLIKMESGLIVQTRYIFSLFVLLILTFTFIQLKKVCNHFYPILLFCFIALFSIPIGNIYSINYNSISLGLFAALFSILLISPENLSRGNIFCLTLFTVILGTIYPTLGIISTFFLITYFFVFNKSKLIFFIFCLLILSFLNIYIILKYTTVDEILNSLKFSSAFGVGSNILSSPKKYLFFFSTYLSLVAIYICQRLFDLDNLTLRRLYSLRFLYRFIFALISFLIILIIFKGYREKHLIAPAISLMCILTTIKMVHKKHLKHFLFTLSYFLICGFTIAATSSNGLPQFQWLAMISPFILIFSRQIRLRFKIKTLSYFLIVSTSIFFLFFFYAFPYRDQHIWNHNIKNSSNTVFNGLYLSKEKSDSIASVQTLFLNKFYNKKLLIVGAQPWIYFALNSIPDTDMIFMHFSGNKTAYSILAEKLGKRTPDAILHLDNSNLETNNATTKIASDNNLTCTNFYINNESLLNLVQRSYTFYPIINPINVCSR